MRHKRCSTAKKEEPKVHELTCCCLVDLIWLDLRRYPKKVAFSILSHHDFTCAHVQVQALNVALDDEVL